MQKFGWDGHKIDLNTSFMRASGTMTLLRNRSFECSQDHQLISWFFIKIVCVFVEFNDSIIRSLGRGNWVVVMTWCVVWSEVCWVEPFDQIMIGIRVEILKVEDILVEIQTTEWAFGWKINNRMNIWLEDKQPTRCAIETRPEKRQNSKKKTNSLMV